MGESLRLCVLTTGRQDFGILRSTLLLLRGDPRFAVSLWAAGMHSSPLFGNTLDAIHTAGLHADVTLDTLGDAADAAGESASTLRKIFGALSVHKPQALLVLGDRHETLAAGFAATLARVPIVHLHGGEETQGAVDNAFRHALTKLSHLHLVSHELHAQRVRQMGEPGENVVVVGAAGLDNLYRDDLPDAAAISAQLGVPLAPPIVVTTLHPTTLGGDAHADVSALSAAMQRVPATYVITQPNSDAGGKVIREHWQRFCAGRERFVLCDALGDTLYFGLLRVASAVLGNSSSGIIEAPAAGLPVINVGDRQRGRLRSAHVHDVPFDATAIEAALREVLAPGARERHASLPQHYLPGPAAPRIVEALSKWQPPVPPRKHFHDLGGKS